MVRLFQFAISGMLILALVSGELAAAQEFDRRSSQDVISQLMADMTLEEKVGQLFLITLYSTTLEAMDRQLIESLHPGGVVLFGHNIQSPEQVTQLTNDLQAYALEVGPDIPLLIAVDQEGGRVSRLTDGFTAFPSMLMVGATNGQGLAGEIGAAMGEEMAAVGINMDLAPVVDLYRDSQDRGGWQVMFRRSFGSDPDLVGDLASEVVGGLRQAGVIGVLKHYPGHGDAQDDSHDDLPEVTLSRAEAEATALHAFDVAIEGGAQAVMVGHLYYPALDTEKRPASLSPMLIDLLRDELGFQGVTVSDAMNMGAVRNHYDLPEAVVEAVKAGVDLITFGSNVYGQAEAAAAVIQAVREGSIPQTRIDEAVRRVLQLRVDYGLLEWQPLDPAGVTERLNLAEHEDTVNRLALDAVTVVRDPSAILPLDGGAQSIAVMFPAMYRQIGEKCRAIDPDISLLDYTYHLEDWEYEQAVQNAQNADVVVVFVEDLAANTAQHDLVWRLPAEKTVVVSMRSPTDYYSLPSDIAALVLTYDSRPATFAAACRVLYGMAAAQGHLPVTLGPYAVGTGLEYSAVQSTLWDQLP